MRRTAWVLALSLFAGCARCKSSDEAPILEDPTKADAAPEVEIEAGAAEIPARWRGTYVVGVVVAADASTPVELRRFEVGARGAGEMHAVVTSPDSVDAIVITPDGATIAYTTQLSTGPESHEQAISVVPLEGGAPKEIARCGYECGLMGVGADGELWFVSRQSGSLTGEVRHVPMKGGATVVWPNAFASCYLSGVTSDDGTALLLGVDDSLGWPDCIDSGRQGFFLVPITDAAKRDRLPKRIDCFTTRKAKEINIQIADLAFDGPDRLFLAVNDGWDPDAGESPDVIHAWSCKRDGTDPRRVEMPPRLSVTTAKDGKQWLVVQQDANDDLEHALHRIVGVDGAITALARRTATGP